MSRAWPRFGRDHKPAPADARFDPLTTAAALVAEQASDRRLRSSENANLGGPALPISLDDLAFQFGLASALGCAPHEGAVVSETIEAGAL